MAKKRYNTHLKEAEIQELTSLTKAGECHVRVYKRARILLLLNEGLSDNAVIKQANVSQSTINRMRQRFHTEGVASIWDKPKSGRPSIFDGEQRAKITVLACSEAPEGRTRWTLRLLADKAVELGLVDDISHETVGVMLKKTNLNLI